MGQGNVHSGATPPWLMTDDDGGGGDSGAGVLIGPSEEEFLRHSKGQSCFIGSYIPTVCFEHTHCASIFVSGNSNTCTHTCA